jgi:hypothetical protein
MLWSCPSVLPWSFTVFRTFLVIFAATALKLGLLCFLVNRYSSSLRFGVIYSFLQELCPWNLEEFKKFSVFRTFIWPSLQLYDWNLGYCFVVKSYNSNLRFGVFDFIFARVISLELKYIEEIFSFPDFFAIFAAI